MDTTLDEKIVEKFCHAYIGLFSVLRPHNSNEIVQREVRYIRNLQNSQLRAAEERAGIMQAIEVVASWEVGEALMWLVKHQQG